MKDSEESFILVKDIKWPEYKKQKLKGADSSAPGLPVKKFALHSF